MAKALFVFDHKYPVDQKGTVYYSSGFDEEFFARYYNIFEQFDILGRSSFVSETSKLKDVQYPSKFYLLKSNKSVFTAHTISIMRKAIRSVDCVIARMPSLFGMLAIKLSKKMRKPYIVEIVACTYDALSSSPSYKRRALAKPAEFIYRSVLRNNPYNIYVTKQFLQKKYPTTGKQIACSNVTLPSVEDEVLERRIKKINRFSRQKIILGTTSTLNVDFKGQKYMIQALPILINHGYDIEYQMVGDGDASWLIKIAREYGVEDRVKVIGRLDHNDVFRWLDNLDVYVHPSCQEGLSRAIIEAMSRGCPIVASDAGGVHELIDDKYIVPIKAPDALADGVIRLLNDNLEKQATINFMASKDYTKSVLYRRREEFYKLFMKETGVI